MTPILAWHFTGAKLRDGRAIPAIGETLRYDGPLLMCKSGLHASERLIDALLNAPGPFVHRVRCGVDIQRDHDKLLCRERTREWGYDASDVLRHFARLCALDVAHLWAVPDVVRQYLETGDETIRFAAEAASEAVAWNAGCGASDTAWAARDAARVAVWATANAGNAVWAAGNALLSAARAAEAARAAQNERLTAMIEAGRP